MSTTKHTTIDQLKKLALRTKSEIGLVDAKVTGLTTKVNDLVTAGGETGGSPAYRHLCYSAGRELERRSADCCTCFPLS